MKTLSSFAVAGLCAVAAAQTGSLQCIPGAPSQVSYWGWTAPSPDHQTFFDLTVNSIVTLQAIRTPLLTPVGQIGTLEVWMTNPGITTYVGNMQTPANWSKVAEGQIIGNGTAGTLASLTVISCQEANGAGLVLVPGSYGVAIRYTNCNPLLVATTAQQTFSNSELSVSGGDLQYNAFVSAPSAPIGLYNGVNYTAWQWRGIIDYGIGVQPHACAETSVYGAGCYTSSGSFWQEWTDPNAAAAAATAMNNRTLSLIPVGGNYLLTQGTAQWIAPSASATALPAVDDGEAPITPVQPFVYPGGVATTLYVHSNGYVSVGSQNTLPGGFNWVPNGPVMLNAPQTAWWIWRDYDPTEAGSGQIVWEEVGSLIVITWNGVECPPATAANPCTFQFQFDTASGQVNYVFQTMGAGGSGFLEGDDLLVGYSPGGPSPAVGPIDLTTVNGLLLTHPERFPLTLAASAKPLLGTTITLDTTNAATIDLGLNLLSLGQIPAPGLDLGFLGMPGCAALIDINSMVGNLISNLPGFSMSITWPLPSNPSLNGIVIYSQSLMLEAGINAFNGVTSNGVVLELGIY